MTMIIFGVLLLGGLVWGLVLDRGTSDRLGDAKRQVVGEYGDIDIPATESRYHETDIWTGAESFSAKLLGLPTVDHAEAFSITFDGEAQMRVAFLVKFAGSTECFIADVRGPVPHRVTTTNSHC